jgi:5-methylcytosine-specific restriction protein A
MAWIKKKKKKHTELKDRKDKDIQKLYNTTTWRKLRDAHLMLHPLCESCLEKGIINDGGGILEVHHKTPISTGKTDIEKMGLAFDANNLRTLCQRCHTEEHKRLRGKRC